MLPYLKSNIAEWLLLQMVIYEKCRQWNWWQTFPTSFIYLRIVHYLPRFVTALVTISAGILPVYVFWRGFLSFFLSHTSPGEEHLMPWRMKRLLELIFILCAIPTAFSKCVMCYHQVWFCNWNAKSLKAQLYWPYQQFALSPKLC